MRDRQRERRRGREREINDILYIVGGCPCSVTKSCPTLQPRELRSEGRGRN